MRRRPAPGSMQENQVTFGFLESIPERSAIRRRLTELWDYERYGVPLQEGGRYFFTYNSGLQNQSVLYTTDSLEAKPRVLLDPNTLSPDGTVALAGYDVSDDGRHLAYGIAAAGSDWNDWKVRDVATGKDLPDHLKWIKFSSARMDPRRPGFLLRAVSRAETRPGPERGELRPESLLPPPGHARRPTTSWSGKIPSTRHGERYRRSPTTASTWS